MLYLSTEKNFFLSSQKCQQHIQKHAHLCLYIHYICLLEVGCDSKCCLGFGSSLLSTVLLTMLYKDQLEFPLPVC